MPEAKPGPGATLNPDNPGGFDVAWFINEGSGTTITDAGTNEYVGNMAATPASWVSGGLEFDDDGTLRAITVTSPAALAFGTGDFSLAFGYVRKEPDSAVGLAISIDAGSLWNGCYISIRPTVIYMYLNGNWYEFPTSGSTADTLYNTVITCNRDGTARLYRNGSYVSEVDISGAAAYSVPADRLCLGGNPGLYSNDWQWEGEWRYLFTAPAVIADVTAAAISGDPYLDMAAAETLSVELTDTLALTDAVAIGDYVALSDDLTLTDAITAEASWLPEVLSLGEVLTVRRNNDPMTLRLDTTETAGDYIFYSSDVAALANDPGTIVQKWFKAVDTSDCGLNQGGNLSVCDGRFHFSVWFREDGFNIDGEAEVPYVLDDDFHLITLVASSGSCSVFIDGIVAASGVAAGPSTKQAVSFGSYVSESLIGA